MKKAVTIKSLRKNIPNRYKILDFLLELRTDFWVWDVPTLVLSPVSRDVAVWYQKFETAIFRAISDKNFLPIIRASDGEYRFLLGPQLPSRRLPLGKRIISYLKYIHAKIHEKQHGFKGQTAPGVSVGDYSAMELKHGRGVFIDGMLSVLKNGLLAAHLQFTPKPFQECYHPAFKRFLEDYKAELTADNYVPFYFVYLFLSRVATADLLRGRSVLFINRASEAKRQVIDARFEQYGVEETRWISLSRDRSLFDRIELTEKDLLSDICILGGGVGKFNLIQQLEIFPGPVVDAGYYFEAWANPDIAKRRPLCIV